MGFDKHSEAIDDCAAQLIRHKANQLVGKYGFTRTDREDLEQEMMLYLLVKAPSFDDQRSSWPAFVTLVINNAIADIAAKRKAAKRDYRLCTSSLNDQLSDDEGNAVERSVTISQDDYFLRTSGSSMSVPELHDLQQDLAKVVALLPPDSQELCGILKYHSIAQISRATGISRSTLYRKLGKIREVFVTAGLGEYLGLERYSFDNSPVGNNQKPGEP